MTQYADLVLGLAVGILVTCCFCFPRVGRAIGKIFATGSIAVGIGLLVWGIVGVSSGDFHPMQCGPVIVNAPSQVIGWGSGVLAGGLTALAFSRTRRPT